jgi:hypothetical protein
VDLQARLSSLQPPLFYWRYHAVLKGYKQDMLPQFLVRFYLVN